MVDRLSLQFATANNNDCNQAVLSGVLCIWLCYVVCKLRIQKIVSLASMFLPGYYLALSFVHFSCHLCTQDNRDHLHYLPHNLCHHSLLRHHRSPPVTAKTKTKRSHNLTLTLTLHIAITLGFHSLPMWRLNMAYDTITHLAQWWEYYGLAFPWCGTASIQIP